MFVKSETTDLGFEVQVPDWAMRSDGRPIARFNSLGCGYDESCGILQANATDIGNFDTNLHSVQCHHFALMSEGLDLPPPSPLQPLDFGPRFESLRQEVQEPDNGVSRWRRADNQLVGRTQVDSKRTRSERESSVEYTKKPEMN